MIRLALPAVLLVATRAWADDTAALYQNACAACHGPAGQGLPADDPRRPMFAPPPTDLTEPLFASSEPRRDWFLVIKHGGPALGLSAQMPSFGEGLADTQIHALVDHVKTFARTERFPPGDVNLLRPMLTKKGFPEDELLILGGFTREKGAPSSGESVLYLGKRLGARSQVEGKLVQAFAAGQTELEEVELGFKHALFFGRGWLLSAGVEAGIPVHFDEEAPRAHAYLAFGMPLGQRFDWLASVEGSDSVPIGDGATGAAELAAATALFFRPTIYKRGLFPGLEVKSATPLEGGGPTAVTVVPQVQARLSRRGHIGVSVGAELPVVNAGFDYRLHGFLIWEFAEGAPWRGW